MIQELNIRLQAWIATAEIIALQLVLGVVNVMPQGPSKFPAQLDGLFYLFFN